MTEASAADITTLQAVVAAKRLLAEHSLDEINVEIRATKAALAELRRRLSQPPLMEGDASFAAIAEGKRASLRREIAGVVAALASLDAARQTRRNAVSRLLCQEDALKSMICAFQEESRRSKSRRA